MDTSRFDRFLGTRWNESGASLLPLAGPDAEIRITAPPRDAHELTETSRILRIFREPDDETGHLVILLSHRG